MSEMRKAARELVQRRSESFESRHHSRSSRERLAHAHPRAGLSPDATFHVDWREVDGRTILDASFLPARGTIALLRALSIAMVALLALTVWILRQPGEGAQRFLVPLFAVLSILAIPFVTLGMSSARAAREARIRRAIRAALLDADEAFPPPQKWADED
jgi:hypothetical protein